MMVVSAGLQDVNLLMLNPFKGSEQNVGKGALFFDLQGALFNAAKEREARFLFPYLAFP